MYFTIFGQAELILELAVLLTLICLRPLPEALATPLARCRLPALVLLIGPRRPKEHCLVHIGLRLAPIAHDPRGVRSLHDVLAVSLVTLHCGRVAAHDGCLDDGHCLQCSTCHCCMMWVFNFLRYMGYQYVRVLVEVMCGCNRGRIPGHFVTGHTVNRHIATRVAGRSLPVPVHIENHAISSPVPSPAPILIRPRIVQQSRFPQRGRFQPSAPPPPLYNPETTVWGPPLWRILHTLAECSDNSPLWFDILVAMETLIPCPTCRAHFTAHKQHNPAPADHQGIVDWFFILHNIVNARIGKPLFDAAGLPTGDKATLLAGLEPVIQGLSVSYPPEFIALLQTMVTSLM